MPHFVLSRGEERRAQGRGGRGRNDTYREREKNLIIILCFEGKRNEKVDVTAQADSYFSLTHHSATRLTASQKYTKYRAYKSNLFLCKIY